MSNQPAQIVQKLWNYCNVLPACAKLRAAGRRDDGMNYGDYLSTGLRMGAEQVVYLLQYSFRRKP